MKHILRTIPLAALALSACGGGAGGGSSGTVAPSSNTSPTIAQLPASSMVPQDGSSDPIEFQVSDAQTDASQLTLSVESSNTDLMPVAGAALGGNAGNRTLILTPEPGKSGTADVTVSVRDAQGLTSSQKLTLSVTAQEQSFKDFALSKIAADAESEPAQTVGYAWTDTAEDDPDAFNTVLSAAAE